MKILIAPDSFRRSMTAPEAVRAIAEGIRRCDPRADLLEMPLADGGEGTAGILALATGGKLNTVQVNDALMRRVSATYGLSGDGQTAFIEMAEASGLERLDPGECNPMKTSTFGTGELIRAALDQGAATVVVCLGGSATNDGGIGMAAALGVRFLDEMDRAIDPIGENLARIRRIDRSGLLSSVRKTRFRVACDVNNPLFGPNGAAFVYAAQKGASPGEIARLDNGLRKLAHVAAIDGAPNAAEMPGSGAAGGLGFGSVEFLGAELTPGFMLVAENLNLQRRIAESDLVITGEGRLDEQTLSGKVIRGVTRLAEPLRVPVVAFCGTLSLSAEQCRRLGLHLAQSILTAPMDLPTALQQGPRLLTEASQRFFQFISQR